VNHPLSLSEAIAQSRLASLERRLSRAGVTVLLDTSVLSEPMRELPAGPRCQQVNTSLTRPKKAMRF